MIAELTIDLGAIRRNVAALGALVAPARYAAVVKSGAYGHGLIPVAKTLADRVAMLCVYRAEEALALRDAAIVTPTLVLGPVESRHLDALTRSNVAIALWSDGAFARDAARAARTRDARLAVHAKIDTGVTRLGLDADGAAGMLGHYLADADLDLRGVFTHLAAAEELESAYTLAQLARFEAALAPLATVLAERHVLRHASASAAAMLFPRLRLDLIRAGIATYGIWPSEPTRIAMRGLLDLEAALSWTSQLAVVRSVEAGRSVGYGCTFVTERPSRIGVVPIGYAEGIPRARSSSGTVLVAGRHAPIVGRICMNMCFVDVTDISEAHTGSVVTLIGRNGEASIDANEFANAAGTIGYEIVARLPAEIPRSYVDTEAPPPLPEKLVRASA